MLRRFVTLAIPALIVVCSFQLMAEPTKILKIAVTADGRITANGRPVSLDALAPILRDLAKSKGTVWYYREAARAEPHPNALKVLNTIVDYDLPVSLSTKPDYSDAVDDKGRSVPRR
jgi:biopolymer transport protein ExbD